jgi:hypothetical protein
MGCPSPRLCLPHESADTSKPRARRRVGVPTADALATAHHAQQGRLLCTTPASSPRSTSSRTARTPTSAISTSATTALRRPRRKIGPATQQQGAAVSTPPGAAPFGERPGISFAATRRAVDVSRQHPPGRRLSCPHTALRASRTRCRGVDRNAAARISVAWGSASGVAAVECRIAASATRAHGLRRRGLNRADGRRGAATGPRSRRRYCAHTLRRTVVHARTSAAGSECRGQTHARSATLATPANRVRPVRGSVVQPARSSRHASSIHLAAPRIALIGVA